jgi:hypothetical protein
MNHIGNAEDWDRLDDMDRRITELTNAVTTIALDIANRINPFIELVFDNADFVGDRIDRLEAMMNNFLREERLLFHA